MIYGSIYCMFPHIYLYQILAFSNVTFREKERRKQLGTQKSNKNKFLKNLN